MKPNEEINEINTQSLKIEEVDKNDKKEISKLMNEIINITKQYKNRNIDELKEIVIKSIKD